MALIQCSKCGKMHSDTAERCPHCGHMTAIYICPECGAVCSKGKGICIECGYDIKDKNLVSASDDEIMRAYGDALQAIEGAMTAEEWSHLEAQFLILGAYKDSKVNADECRKKAEKCKQLEMTYIKIKDSLGKANDVDALKTLKGQIESIGDYEDVEALLSECNEKLHQLIYADACVELDNATKVTSYRRLMQTFEEIIEYKDAKDKYEFCKKMYEKKRVALKKRIIRLIVGIIAVVGMLTLYVMLIQPRLTYNSAVKEFENEEYSEAAIKFTELGDYKDAAEKAEISYYEYGKKCIYDENYNAAFGAFENAKGYKDAQNYASYAKGMNLLAQNEYEEAIDEFEMAGDVEDSEARYQEANYKYGVELFEDNLYEDAKTYFNKAGSYSDAKDKYYACGIMQAEEYWDKGYLNNAQRIYKKLPKSYEYKGISVSDRLKTLSKNSGFLKLCGKWEAGDGVAKTRQISKNYGSWNEWTTEFSDGSLEVTCKIKSNGKVEVNGNAVYYVYDDYSSISQYLELKYESKPFSIVLPSAGKTMRIGDYTTLAFTDGKFVLNYSRNETNADMYFNYLYRTTQKYTRSKKY